jgi:hypothetical protein
VLIPIDVINQPTMLLQLIGNTQKALLMVGHLSNIFLQVADTDLPIATDLNHGGL